MSAIRVVVVDDHPVVRDGLRGLLEQAGIEVVGEASGGDEAVVRVMALGDEVDVVLMDLRMPGGGGAEAIRRLRAAGALPRILVLTTYDTDHDIRSAMEAGADGYLLKDARRADLVRAVEDLASGRTVLAPEALRALSRTPQTATDLTAREIEVLRVIGEGGTNKTAADRLFVSEATVKTHLARAYVKLGVSDRAAAIRVAFERGLI